jgi:uncharacterized membrane protein
MVSTPSRNAGRLGLAGAALACAALTLTGLASASAPPAAYAARAHVAPPAANMGRLSLVGAAAAPAAPRPGPEPADTPGGFGYRASQTGPAVFTSLRNVPGAAITAHLGINNHGQYTGTYIDDDAVPNPDGLFDTGHGFVQDRRGHSAGFDVPGASVTLPNGINDLGTIAGAYVDADSAPQPGGAAPPGSVHGFIRDRRGTITAFEVPYWRLHNVSDLNNRGQIVGYYDQPDFAGGGAFLRDRDGTITTITYPGAAYTLAHGINDRGQVVGAYLEPGAAPNPDGTIPAGTVHGFVWQRGRFATFNVPGSIFTQAFGINDRSQIVGGYRDASGRQRGFLRDGNRYRTLDAPGGNIASGINDRGQIVLPDSRAAGLLPVAT